MIDAAIGEALFGLLLGAALWFRNPEGPLMPAIAMTAVLCLARHLLLPHANDSEPRA